MYFNPLNHFRHFKALFIGTHNHILSTFFSLSWGGVGSENGLIFNENVNNLKTYI